MRGIRSATDEERRAIFTPGNVVPSYGRHLDQVIEYHEGDNWSVTVKGLDGQVRNHATNPDIVTSRRLIANSRITYMVGDIPVAVH